MSLHADATQLANPIIHINGCAAPFLMIHGDTDLLVLFGQRQLLVEALQRQAISVTLHMIIRGGDSRCNTSSMRLLVEAFCNGHVHNRPTIAK